MGCFKTKKKSCVALLWGMAFMCHAISPSLFIVGGPTFSGLNNEKSVALNTSLTNHYVTSKKTHWDGLWGAGAGVLLNVERQPLVVWLGIAGYAIQFGTIKGLEYPFANDGVFDSLNYRFNARSSALLAESRWFYTTYKDWQPFALLGIGGAWNKLNRYGEVPTNPALSAAPIPRQFGPDTTTSFAYELGLGLQRLLYEDKGRHLNYRGSIDYRYISFGEGNLGRISTQTTNQRLRINHLYTQGILFSLYVS